MRTKPKPPLVPRDRWLRAGTPTTEPYPCMCRGSRACTKRCPCYGRHDGEAMPAQCCARAVKTEARNANEENE